MYAYVGSTTMPTQGGPATGITIVDLDGPTSSIHATATHEAVQPMYLATSPNRSVLYATQATDEGRISAWRIDDNLRLSPLGHPRPSGGSTPCHLSVHPSGRYLLTANYTSGTIAIHPLNHDGSLAEPSHVLSHQGDGPHKRQDAAHPHMIITDPVHTPGRGHILAVDLGTDTIHRYQLDLDTGRLTETDHIAVLPGTGPRHLAIHDRHAYLVGELASTLTTIDLVTSPPTVCTEVPTHVTGGTEPSYPSAIRLSPDGRHVYVLNRGPNTIATFALDGPKATLTATTDAGGDYPWDAILHDGHMYVVNQRTSTLTVFHIDTDTGIPRPTGTQLDVPHPVCILPVAPGSRHHA
ncbi:lactonase family protein [Phytoactinopolyspora endophytica]|uniref:lactonase family protein n=1 Tax=Phytoactinopolyspora endophytica TaxID=1642495 RepID=UPI00101DE89B|nr:lactonase family protein [Phytoactinopolyspora endophytica]